MGGSWHMFFKKEDKFNVHLHNIAENLMEATKFFTQFEASDTKEIKAFADKMKEFEKKGDDIVHNVIRDLNAVFITPIEREDILALAMNMDDVLDGLEHTAAFFEMFSMKKFDNYMLQYIEVIKNSVEQISKAVDLLSKKKLVNIREHAILIKDYESKCDEIFRVSIKHLFEVEKDPIRIIQYKEIYEEFENIADCCQNVANTFEAIIMKNA